MSKYIFLFDLDSTITKEEILPKIAEQVGLYKEMRELTDAAMTGVEPFKKSFLKRIDLLRQVSVDDVQRVVENIQLNEKIVEFIQKNIDRCYIVTGNLDVWIERLIQRIGVENNVFCSRALVRDGFLQDVFSIVDKYAVVQQMVLPFVAVGDGNNDAEMIEKAEIGIGYGGVRAIAPAIMECATHVVYDEDKLVDFLNKLI